MRVALIHGFRVSDGGRGTVDRLAPILEAEGHEPLTKPFDYGWVGLIRVRLANREVVDRLLKLAPDAVVCHSNGAAIVWRAAQQGLALRVAILVQPALAHDACFPPAVERIQCSYNHGDWAVQLGRVWRVVNPVSWFARHAWGAAGYYGLTACDRAENIDTGEGPVPAYGHSAIWQPERLCYWAPRMVESLGEAEASDTQNASGAG